MIVTPHIETSIVETAQGCVKFIEEKKAENVLLLDLRDVNSYLDYFLIATGSSRIHCRGLHREISRFMKEKGFSEANKPDLESGWIIMDYGELIIHLFTEETRDYYRLEKLWGDAVKLNSDVQSVSG